MKKNIIITAIIIIGLLTALITNIQRASAEFGNKSVGIILDYKEARDMAKQSDKDLSWWLKEFNRMGIRYVSLHEETLESMIEENKPVKAVMGKHLLQEFNWRDNYPEELVEYIDENGISEFDVVVITNTESVFDFIKEGLKSRYNARNYEIIAADKPYYVILLRGNIRDALYSQERKLFNTQGKAVKSEIKLESSKLITDLSFGFDPAKIQMLKDSGLKIFPRPHSYNRWVEDKYIYAVIKDFEKHEIKPSLFIFGGKEILGYPNAVEPLFDYMAENNIKAGMIETSVQRGHLESDGLESLVINLNYNAVRVFTMWPFIQERFRYFGYEGAEEIENTLYRAVTERNIRAIFFKPFKIDNNVYVTDVAEYEKMFASLKNRIEKHGMSIGESSAFSYIRVRFIKQVLMGWGIAAAGVLLIYYLFRIKKQRLNFLLGGSIVVVPIILRLIPEADKFMALSASLIFPVLALTYYCHKSFKYLEDNEKSTWYRKIKTAVKDLLIVSGISLTGALFVAAVLSDIKYLLEMDIFRGVKLSQIMPMVIYCGMYMAYFGYRRDDYRNKSAGLKYEDIKKLLFENFKVVYIILIGIISAVGYIYISRMGHEAAVQPSQFEILFRNLLERTFLARPRTKEFLIGYPALMIGVFAAFKKYRSLIFVSGLFAMIGQTSIINTFSHLRTPLYVSSIRTAYSLIIGIIAGIVYILLLEAGIKIFKTLKKADANE